VHTIVLVSDKTRIDDSLQKAFEALFPECRIEVIDVRHPAAEDNPVATGSVGDA